MRRSKKPCAVVLVKPIVETVAFFTLLTPLQSGPFGPGRGAENATIRAPDRRSPAALRAAKRVPVLRPGRPGSSAGMTTGERRLRANRHPSTQALGRGQLPAQLADRTVGQPPYVAFAVLRQALQARRQSNAQFLDVALGQHGVAADELPGFFEGHMNQLFDVMGECLFHATHSELPAPRTT